MTTVGQPYNPMIDPRFLFQQTQITLSSLTSVLARHHNHFTSSPSANFPQYHTPHSEYDSTDAQPSLQTPQLPQIPDLFPQTQTSQLPLVHLNSFPTINEPEHDISLASDPLLFAAMFKLTRIMLFNFAFTVSSQIAGQVDTTNCETCIQSGLPYTPLPTPNIFSEHDMTTTTQDQPTHLSLLTPQLYDAFQNVHVQTEFQLNAIFSTLHQTLHIRQTEIIQSFVLLFELCRRHWLCGSFAILRDNLMIVYIVCVLLAHKLSNDQPYSNRSFAALFALSLPVINEYERTIIFLLNYELIVTPAQFMAVLHNLEQEYSFFCSLNR